MDDYDKKMKEHKEKTRKANEDVRKARKKSDAASTARKQSEKLKNAPLYNSAPYFTELPLTSGKK